MRRWVAVFRYAGVFAVCFGATLWVARTPATETQMDVPIDLFEQRVVHDWREIAALGRRTGFNAGPIEILVFADYQCRACAQFHDALHRARRVSSADFAVVKFHFPLSSHPHALAAANAAECAGDQGRFESFEDVLYQYQDQIGQLGWEFFAAAALVENLPVFNECTDAMHHRRTIQRHQQIGRRLQIIGTPTFLINDILYVGAVAESALLRLLHELQTTSTVPSSKPPSAEGRQSERD